MVQQQLLKSNSQSRLGMCGLRRNRNPCAGATAPRVRCGDKAGDSLDHPRHEFFKQCWPEAGQGKAQGPLFAWVELRTCPPAARGYKGCSRVAPAFPHCAIHLSRSLARWACTELSTSWGLPSYLLPSALFEREERQIKAFSLRATWVTHLESLVEEKTHSGLFWAVLLKESTGPLKCLQAQFRSPWKFHCNVVWYVIQQNRIFPVNVLNMCSSKQQVQRGQQWAEMRGCISACSCITLTSKEPLEIAVPLFSAFMEDEKKKGEGRKSFLGAGATCLVHISVYKRERDDSAAVQWIFLLAWSRDDQKSEFILQVLFHQFHIQKMSFSP